MKKGAARAETGDFRLDAPKSFSRHLSFYTEMNRDQAKMREDGRKRYLNGTMMKRMAERGEAERLKEERREGRWQDEGEGAKC